MDRSIHRIERSLKMLPVSVEFETAIKATTRRFVPRVEVTWTDPTIDPTIDADATDKNYTSYPVQVADLQTLPSYKYFHLDGICKFDGSYHIAPALSEIATVQMGYWGATACNGSAQWSAPYPTIIVDFAARPITSLVVVGDSQYNEYPVDFDIEIYNAADVLIYSVAVTGNTRLNWNLSVSEENINDATYMKLILKKWSLANRVAKILEFYTSLAETYTGDEVVSMNLLEEREVSDGSIPIGNISANELDLSLQNIRIIKDGESIVDPFFPSNPNTYLQNVIKKNRKIRAWIGLYLPDDSVEYLSLGTFWSGDWNANDQDSTIQTSARDRMELLRNAICSTLPLYENISLYDLAENLLNNAKSDIPMPDLIWEIDIELQSFMVPYGYFPRQDYFKCIKDLVTACMGVAYMSRDDVLIINGPSSHERPGTVTTEGA
jgi:hypothetical protein